MYGLYRLLPFLIIFGYPPDKQEKATATVHQQAELLCADWAEKNEHEDLPMTATYGLPEAHEARETFRSKPVDARNIHVVVPTYNDCAPR